MFHSAPQTYYPYGLPTSSIDSKINSYLYGEKEFEQRQGLNTYDFLARTYAPDECRFWQPDPLATDNHGFSPYIYCDGDPVNYVDRDGRKRVILTKDRKLVSSFQKYINYDNKIHIIGHGSTEGILYEDMIKIILRKMSNKMKSHGDCFLEVKNIL